MTHGPTLHKTLPQRFGERVQAIRNSKGKTQLQVATEIDINRGYLSEIENGHKEPTLGKMAALATYFDLTLSDLLRDL
jgi:transcriptional regulator with XRE-family HTH domain